VLARAFFKVIADAGLGPLIGGMEIDNDGKTIATRFVSNLFEIVSPNAANGIEFRDGYLRVWGGNSQRIIGAGFGKAGDRLIRAVANRLLSFSGDSHVVARLDGDAGAGLLRDDDAAHPPVGGLLGDGHGQVDDRSPGGQHAVAAERRQIRPDVLRRRATKRRAQRDQARQ